MKQGASLTAKADFTFKSAAGRKVTVRTGQRFWVTNSETDQERSGAITIDREGRGCISHGHAFAPATVAEWFA